MNFFKKNIACFWVQYDRCASLFIVYELQCNICRYLNKLCPRTSPNSLLFLTPKKVDQWLIMNMSQETTWVSKNYPFHKKVCYFCTLKRYLNHDIFSLLSSLVEIGLWNLNTILTLIQFPSITTHESVKFENYHLVEIV